MGGPENNPLPPACSPELPNTDAAADSQDGQQCPANKLVITPKTPIRDGSAFTVKVSYTGRPGVHNDGDGTTEGWFRASDGGFVTTEPVASEDWMPLNDHPTAKPTYDFCDTVGAGKTAVANGTLACTPAGRKAFQESLIKQFDTTYARAGSFWTAAPSGPTPYGLFDNAPTYERPGAAYIALWQILGTARFTRALRQIQRHYGGGTITESQLEAGFRHWLPNQSTACRARLSQFFTQWFDTAYPSGGGASRPAITGPGLAGPGFYDSSCRA